MSEERLQSIEKSVGRIELALLGDSTLGVPGMVKRVGAVEGKQKASDKQRLYLVGFVAGVSGTVTLLVNYYLQVRH